MIRAKTATLPKSKKSAKLAHGLYAKDLLMPWDDREEFDALHNGLKKEFFPNGLSEDECVLDLAQLFWQKRTLWRLRTAAVYRDRFTEEILATEKSSWTGIRLGLREKAREEHSLLRSLEAAAAKAVSGMSRATREFVTNANSEEAERIKSILTPGIELVRDSLLPLLDEVRGLPSAEGAFDRNYLAEAMEKIVRLETALDARIHKVTARLVALKEFKRTPAGGPTPQSPALRPLGVLGDSSKN